jgi:hypothetical protein
MSIEAMTLVLHHAKASVNAQMVLMCIANHQGDGGAWPSIATLAKYTKLSERRVQQIIRDLQLSGELIIHEKAGGITATGITNLYFVNIACPSECDGTTNHRVGVQSPTPRGAGDFTPGVQAVSPKPSLEPSVKPFNIVQENENDFEAFYNTYPRKKNPLEAKRAFYKALQTAKAEVIIAGAQRYADDPNLPFDKTFIPHPATWLNKGGWMNGPEPERTRTPEEIKAQELAAAQRRRETDLEHTRKVVQESVQAAETAEAPHCEHGRIIAACMPCIRAGKI